MFNIKPGSKKMWFIVVVLIILVAAWSLSYVWMG